jgi:hypothetical protein
MKVMKKTVFKYALALLVASSLGSCKKLTEDLYTDPNNPQDVPAELILPAASLATALIHEGEVARLTGMWSGYFDGADRQYIALDAYQATAADSDGPWGNLYWGAFSQADIILQKANALKNPRLAAIAKIHKALAAGTAASIWGDVPFTEANKLDVTRTPKFDGQAAVYNGAIALLDDAIKDIESGKGGIVNASKDLFYNGNFTKWVKAAYSLKARYHLHLKEYAKAVESANKGILTKGDELVMQHGEELGNLNTYYMFLDYDRYGYMMGGSYLYKLMKDRQNAKTDESERILFYFTDETGEEPNYVDGIFAYNAPFTIIGAAETKLILAEASLRGAGGEGAALAALNAHREAMGFAPYDASDFNNGGIENKDGLSSRDALLREILEEKYVSMYGNLEGFNDLRRTWKENTVRVKVPLKNNTATSIPQRLLYPQSEVNTNPNVPSPLPGLFEPTPVNK